jgi:hypothetical protein
MYPYQDKRSKPKKRALFPENSLLKPNGYILLCQMQSALLQRSALQDANCQSKARMPVEIIGCYVSATRAAHTNWPKLTNNKIK